MRTDIPFGLGLLLVIAGAVMLILAAFDVATSPDFNIAWLGLAVAVIGLKIPLMSRLDDTQEFQLPPEPSTPFERKVYIVFFLGVLALLTVGMGFTWMFLAATGNADNFPSALQNLTYLLVAFWIGVQVPSPLNR